MWGEVIELMPLIYCPLGSLLGRVILPFKLSANSFLVKKEVANPLLSSSGVN